MTHDQILDQGTTFFELLVGAFQAYNCYVLYRDKAVKGASILAFMCYVAWNLFNLGFYSYLHLWWAFVGNLWLCWTNAVWVGLAIVYRSKGVK